MKLLENQQNLILKQKSSEYMVQLVRLLQSKDKEGLHYLKRKNIAHLDKRKSMSNFRIVKNSVDINNNENNIIEQSADNYKSIADDEKLLNSEIIRNSPIKFKENKHQNKVNQRNSSILINKPEEEYNFPHVNDYLDSDFTIEEKNYREKEKKLYSKN